LSINYCPICFEELEVIETTPCICWGNDETKISILKQDVEEGFIHDTNIYSLYRAYEEIECVICDICTNDFSAMNPEFFGFPKNNTMHPGNFQFLKPITTPAIVKDKFCNSCHREYGKILVQ
jgi:hypothetical protein